MKWLPLLLPCLLLLLLAGTLVLNRVPLFDPPGTLPRLRVYLGSNQAETRLDHAFPELRTPVLALSPEQAAERVAAAMRELGWRDVRVAGDGELRAVVRTPLLGFRDDVWVRLEPGQDGVLLHARSASRVGKGDFGANSRHLRELFAALDVR